MIVSEHCIFKANILDVKRVVFFFSKLKKYIQKNKTNIFLFHFFVFIAYPLRTKLSRPE